MKKDITCYIANPSFGKSEKDDSLAIKQIDKVVDKCVKDNCHNIVVCGGMYSFTKQQAQDFKYVLSEVEYVSKNLPKNLNINYKILGGSSEIFVLKRNLFDMNKSLQEERSDIESLGFDRKDLGNTLIKCRYNKQNNLGFNEGEIINFKGHVYDPSIRLNKIIQDFNGDLVLVGGKNRFEEFIYNNKLVLALPSIMNPSYSETCPDIGFVMVERNDSLDVKQYVKCLNKKPKIK